jgi:hypothetical protein
MRKVGLYILFSILLISTSYADPQPHYDDWDKLNAYSRESEKNPWGEITIEGSALFLKKENGEKIKLYKFNEDKYDVYVSRIMSNIYIFSIKLRRNYSEVNLEQKKRWSSKKFLGNLIS